MHRPVGVLLAGLAAGVPSPPGSCDWPASYSPCRGAVRRPCRSLTPGALGRTFNAVASPKLTHAFAGPAQPVGIGCLAPPPVQVLAQAGFSSTVTLRPPPGWRMRPFAALTAGLPATYHAANLSVRSSGGGGQPSSATTPRTKCCACGAACTRGECTTSALEPERWVGSSARGCQTQEQRCRGKKEG